MAVPEPAANGGLLPFPHGAEGSLCSPSSLPFQHARHRPQGAHRSRTGPVAEGAWPGPGARAQDRSCPSGDRAGSRISPHSWKTRVSAANGFFSYPWWWRWASGTPGNPIARPYFFPGELKYLLFLCCFGGSARPFPGVHAGSIAPAGREGRKKGSGKGARPEPQEERRPPTVAASPKPLLSSQVKPRGGLSLRREPSDGDTRPRERQTPGAEASALPGGRGPESRSSRS